MFDNIAGRAEGLSMPSLHFIIHPLQSGDTVLISFNQSITADIHKYITKHYNIKNA